MFILLTTSMELRSNRLAWFWDGKKEGIFEFTLTTYWACSKGLWYALVEQIEFYSLVYMLRSKIENAHWAGKLTTTRCGIRETATTRNFVSWLFLNNHNALWHVKICHEAKVVSWLLKDMTTSSDFTKIPQDINLPAEGSVSVSSPQLASDRATSCCFLQPCLLTVWRRFLMKK